MHWGVALTPPSRAAILINRFARRLCQTSLQNPDCVPDYLSNDGVGRRMEEPTVPLQHTTRVHLAGFCHVARTRRRGGSSAPSAEFAFADHDDKFIPYFNCKRILVFDPRSPPTPSDRT